MNNYTLIMIVFLVCFMLSRVVSRSAIRKLDAETRHRVYDEFTARSSTKLIVIVALCVAYLLAITYLPTFLMISSISFYVLFLLYLFVSLYLTHERLLSIHAPSEYIRAIMISWSLFLIGFAAIAAGFVYF